MKFRIENCNYYLIKELLESSSANISDIEKVNPETAVVRFNEKMKKSEVEDIINTHPIKDVVSGVIVSEC
ncbi:MAG: hypothetical protein PHH04_08400 [Thomasclavelia sp.]|nr:hypothetical protein [Thomasclavelia sp.]